MVTVLHVVDSFMMNRLSVMIFIQFLNIMITVLDFVMGIFVVLNDLFIIGVAVASMAVAVTMRLLVVLSMLAVVRIMRSVHTFTSSVVFNSFVVAVVVQITTPVITLVMAHVLVLWLFVLTSPLGLMTIVSRLIAMLPLLLIDLSLIVVMLIVMLV